MNKSKTNQYLEVQVQTASKEQLLLMLYDGAIRFGEQAKAKIDEKDIEGSYHLLVKAKQIVVELLCSLDERVGKELYDNLGSLYNFVYIRLIEANIKKDKNLIDEALQILMTLRNAWFEAIEKHKKEVLEGTIAAVKPPERTSFSIEG